MQVDESKIEILVDIENGWQYKQSMRAIRSVWMEKDGLPNKIVPYGIHNFLVNSKLIRQQNTTYPYIYYAIEWVGRKILDKRKVQEEIKKTQYVSGPVFSGENRVPNTEIKTNGDELKKKVEGLKPFLNRLPSGFMLNLFIPNAVALTKVVSQLNLTMLELDKPDDKALYAVLTSEQEEKFDELTAPEVEEDTSFNNTKQYTSSPTSYKRNDTIKTWNTCDYCHIKYPVKRIRKKRPAFRKCCSKQTCKTQYKKEWRNRA